MAEGLARSGFDIDLRDGVAREDAFVHVFLKSKVEHKRDEKCIDTGNVFIEIKQKGRMSGLAVTTAEYWATEFEPECWLILPVKRLKTLVRRYGKNPKNLKLGGDHNQYLGVIIPIKDLVTQR